MNADQQVTEIASTREIPIFTDIQGTKTAPKHPDQNDQKHDDNHQDNTRSNKTKSKTHTHASRSCGARREPWRARSELLRRTRHKINIGRAGGPVNNDQGATLRELHEAQWPTERTAALFLARLELDPVARTSTVWCQ